VLQQQEAAVDDVDPEVIDRRHRNNLAAKRYRQKKIDRIEELEGMVKEVTQERDDLRIQLARQEAEVAALREKQHQQLLPLTILFAKPPSKLSNHIAPQHPRHHRAPSGVARYI